MDDEPNEPYSYEAIKEITTQAQADILGVVAEILHDAAAEAIDDGEPNADLLVNAAIEFEQQLAERRLSVAPGGYDELSDGGWHLLAAAQEARRRDDDEAP